jgi:hypothetical protein
MAKCPTIDRVARQSNDRAAELLVTVDADSPNS